MTPRRSAIQPNRLANRRPGVSPGRRFALALGLALALLGSAGGASADSGSAPMVSATIYASGGATNSESVSSSQLLADPTHCPAYSPTQMDEHSSSGATSVGLPQEHGSGTGTWSVATILGCLQPTVSPSDVTGITILNSDGSPQVSQGSQLTPPDVATPSDFQPNTDSPVVSDLGSAFQYNRPWRGQSDDFNADDQVTSSDPISIEVFEGPPLTVSATASRATVAAGSSVTFNAQVAGNQSSALTYDWSFGDNLPDSRDATPAVTYTDAGSYTVRLEVTDTNGGGGGTTVPIAVTGSPAPPTTASTPETSTGPAGTGTNPNGGTHGTTAGNGKGTGTQFGGGNGNHSGRPSQDQTGAPSASSSHREKPSASGTGPNGGSGGPNGGSGGPSSGSGGPSGGSGGSSGGSGGGGAGSPSATTPSSSAARHHPAPGNQDSRRAPTHTRPPSTAAEPGQLVTGRLVADVIPRSAGASPLVQRSPGSAAAAPSPRKPSSNSPLAVIGGCLAIVLLLGLGAGRELRGPGWWRALRFSS